MQIEINYTQLQNDIKNVISYEQAQAQYNIELLTK